MEIEEFESVIEALVKELSIYKQVKMISSQIFEALLLLNSDTYKIERAGDLWDIEISYQNWKEQPFSTASLTTPLQNRHFFVDSGDF